MGPFIIMEPVQVRTAMWQVGVCLFVLSGLTRRAAAPDALAIGIFPNGFFRGCQRVLPGSLSRTPQWCAGAGNTIVPL